eukprot:15290182-Alexandrium_andersonii.AAC.1
MVRSITWANQETMGKLGEMLRLTGRPIYTRSQGRTRNYNGWTAAAEARINDLQLSAASAQGGGTSTSGTGSSSAARTGSEVRGGPTARLRTNRGHGGRRREHAERPPTKRARADAAQGSRDDEPREVGHGSQHIARSIPMRPRRGLA